MSKLCRLCGEDSTHNESETFLLVVGLDFTKLTLAFLFFDLYLSSLFFFNVLCASTFGALFKDEGHSLSHGKVLITAVLAMDKSAGAGGLVSTLRPGPEDWYHSLFFSFRTANESEPLLGIPTLLWGLGKQILRQQARS